MITIDAQTLGMAMDMVDEDDAVIGVIGRGTKAERVIARYEQLIALAHVHTSACCNRISDHERGIPHGCNGL